MTTYKQILAIGQEAAKFLQGQLSCDITQVTDTQPSLGAYCNIKGKVQAILRLQQLTDGYSLVLPADLSAQVRAELQKYAIFSKVKISVENAALIVDDLQEISQQIPEVYAATYELFFPHDLNLPQLNAISFTKGCYRGQEIIARMHYRGTIKRSLYMFSSSVSNILPGTAILNQRQEVAGTVVRTAAERGLAVLTHAILEGSSALLIEGTTGLIELIN